METKNKYMVGIWCPTYQQAKYIVDTLNGFTQQQTSFPFLVMLVDDASTDGEPQIIADYLNTYFDFDEQTIALSKEDEDAVYRFARHKINSDCFFLSLNLKVNLWKNREKKDSLLGHYLNSYKYIALCEGDDYWTDPYKLQKQVDFLESHPDYSMCFHRAKIEYEGIKGVRILCDQVETREYSPNELLKDWYIPTASIVCRKECYDVPLVDSEKFVNGDVVLMLKCASVGKIYGFSDSMSVYRVHSTGVSYDKSRQKFYAQRFPDHYKCIKKNFPFLDKNIANARISHGYYTRAVHPNSPLACIRDLFMSFCYSPAEFVRSIQNAIRKRVK